MAANGDSTAGSLAGVERVLGRIRGPRPGPTLIGVGGLHGNEPAGIRALRSVLEEFGTRQAQVSGEFVALSGNRAALAQGRRFLSRDLNRLWTPSRIRALEDGISSDPAESAAHSESVAGAEDEEFLELHEVAHEVISEARGPVFLLDLHTASGPAKPFTSIMDSLTNRKFALSIPVPLVLGLGKLVEGTLLGYLADRGISAVVFEGGHHHHPSTLASLRAALWLGLSGAGVIPESIFPEVTWARKRLIAATDGLPPVLELRYRHPVTPDDGFEMLPGFRSFQPIVMGQVMARDRNGDVQSPESGRLLLPLYQTEGEDGFFLVRESG